MCVVLLNHDIACLANQHSVVVLSPTSCRAGAVIRMSSSLIEQFSLSVFGNKYFNLWYNGLNFAMSAIIQQDFQGSTETVSATNTKVRLPQNLQTRFIVSV